MKKIILFGLLAIAAMACQTKEKKTAESVPAEQLTPVAYEIVIEGMTCTGCEETIEGSINKLDGIKMVEADHLKGNAMIELFIEKTDTTAVKEAITGSGYKVIGFRPAAKITPAE